MPIERAEAQGHDGNFTICHTLLKKAILHLKMATVRIILNTAVGQYILIRYISIILV